MRARRVVAVAAFALLAGCGGHGDAPAAPTRYGLRGGVRIGVRITGDGLTSVEPGRFRAARSPASVHAEVSLAFTETGCTLPPCAPPGRVRVRLSALYDLSRPIAVQPREIEVAATERTTPVTITLPDRSPGRHCLLLVVAEPAEDVVTAEAPQHVLASASILEIGGSTAAACAVPDAPGTRWAPVRGDRPCPGAVLSSRTTEMTARLVADPLYAYVPRCSRAAYAVLLRDTEFVLPVLRLPAGAPASWAELRDLAPGGWREIFVQDYGRSLHTSVSEPVLVK